MSEKKTDQAMRLMEALDGVDPELLARSEHRKKIIPFQYYTRIAAACLALLVAGSVLFVTVHNKGAMGKHAATSDAPNGFSGNGMGNSVDLSENIAPTSQSGFHNAEAVQADEAQNSLIDDIQGDNYEEATEQDTQKEADSRGDMNQEQYQGATAALNEQKTDANSQNYDITFSLEKLFKKLGLKKNENEGTTAPHASGKVAVTLANETVICNTDSLVQLYEYLADLELGEGISEDMQAEDQRVILLSKVKEDGQKEDWIAIGDSYMKSYEEEMVYPILDEDYNFDALCMEVERIMQEEKK